MSSGPGWLMLGRPQAKVVRQLALHRDPWAYRRTNAPTAKTNEIKKRVTIDRGPSHVHAALLPRTRLAPTPGIVGWTPLRNRGVRDALSPVGLRTPKTQAGAVDLGAFTLWNWSSQLPLCALRLGD